MKANFHFLLQSISVCGQNDISPSGSDYTTIPFLWTVLGCVGERMKLYSRHTKSDEYIVQKNIFQDKAAALLFILALRKHHWALEIRLPQRGVECSMCLIPSKPSSLWLTVIAHIYHTHTKHLSAKLLMNQRNGTKAIAALPWSPRPLLDLSQGRCHDICVFSAMTRAICVDVGSTMGTQHTLNNFGLDGIP